MQARLRISLSTLKSPNFAILGALSLRDMKLIEHAKRVESKTSRSMGKRIGAREWVTAIEGERTRRGGK